MRNIKSIWNMGKLKLYFIGVIVVIITINAEGQNTWSLENCINYALDNNIQIKQSELASENYEIDLLQSKLDLLPTLNGSASRYFGWGRSLDQASNEYTTNNTTQDYFSVSSGLMLFNGLQKYNTIKRARFEYLASKYDSDKMRDDISLMIAGAYLQILFSLELVKTTENQVEITTQQIARTKKLVEAGTLARGDLLDIQSQGAMEEVNLINAQNQINLANLDLLQLLDMSSSERFDIEKPDIQISETPKLLPSEQIYKYAILNLPEVKSAEYRFESANKSLAIARGSRSPNIRLSGSWGTSYSDQIKDWEYSIDPITGKIDVEDLGITSFPDQIRNNENKTLAVSLSVPIYNGFQVSSYINKSKLASLNAEYDLDLTRNTVRKNVETSYTDALAAYKTYQANLKSLESFREAFKYMEQKFDVGLVNSLDYNVAKTQLTKAESDLLSAKYDYVFKTLVLDFYMGQPISLNEFHD